MKCSILAIACICMTLGITLAANYGSYGIPSYGYPSYGGGYYGAQGQGGVGQGGLLMLFGFLFLILLLTNGSLFNSTSTATTTSPTFTLIGG